MDLINKLTIRLFGQKIGSDEFGNEYYQGKKSNKRYVIYNGYAEPSKVPASWHGWLHYTHDEAPVNINTHKYSWQKTHMPNLTGTKFAYFPQGSSKGQENNNSESTKEVKAKRVNVSSDYQAWNPNQQFNQ